MAQSNLAREPSMDEILASIRRIIESNDTVGPGQPANDAGTYRSDRPYGEEELEEIELTIDEEMLAAEFEAEQVAALGVSTHADEPDAAPQFLSQPDRSAEPAPRVSAQTPIAPPPLSLADVAARVRAASDRQMGRPEPVAAARSEPPAVLRDAVQPAQLAPVAPVPKAIRAEEVSKQEPVVAPVADAVREEKHLEPVAIVESAPASDTPTPVAADHAASPTRTGERPMPAIVSAAVSEQVSRAFTDLAMAVDQGPRRSFDEIAEDMLRPMLQEWLDDNLPTLVERLVREEIERVARGPRR